MSASAARRLSAPLAYRRLLKSSHGACAASGLETDSMQHYVRQRFAQIASSPLRFDGTPSSKLKEKVHDAVLIADCFDAAQGNSELASILQILSAGVGNEPLRRNLERGFFDLVHHASAKEARNEADDDSSSERQNQLMQQAAAPYAVRLLEFHDPKVAAAPSSRSAVSVHVVDHGTDTLVIEIDDSLNKQVLYVMSKEPQRDAAADLEPMGDADPGDEDAHQDSAAEDVEVMRPEVLRNVTIHAEWYSIAQRLYESAMKESPMHRSRSSVVVGYGRGGAIAVAVALLLASQDFNVRNTITFGSPKTLTHYMERQVFAMTPIRVVAAGDARVESPISSSEGDPFVHVGEILVMEKGRGGEVAEGALADDEDPFSLRAYCEMLQSHATVLTYGEGDDVWDEGPQRKMMKGWAASSQLDARDSAVGGDQPPQ
jgi:hypothetical protein